MVSDSLFDDAIVKEVQNLIDRAASTGARVSAWDDIQAILLHQKLAWHVQIPPEFVGVHPSNRSKLGVGGSEARHHGARILRAGFSNHAQANAWDKSM